MPSFVAVLVEIKPGQTVDIPGEVVSVLEESQDMMALELPKRLPPRRVVDNAIELEAGSRPLAQAPYRMSPFELAELRKQVNELLDARIHPTIQGTVWCPSLVPKEGGWFTMHVY